VISYAYHDMRLEEGRAMLLIQRLAIQNKKLRSLGETNNNFNNFMAIPKKKQNNKRRDCYLCGF
jgi:hypothetical protein